MTKAKDTGGKAAMLLRMGQPLDRREAVVAALRDGQRPDGGWSQDGEKSDLGTSYRIMRCLFMLGEKPDLDRLRGFIGARRQSDGGYGPNPGAAADPGSTYLCSIMLHWARKLDGEPSITETIGFVPIFDGQSLDGWEGDTNLWAAKDGKIVATSPGLNHNEFLATEGELSRLHPPAQRSASAATTRPTAASSSAASASPARRCRATRPTSASSTGAASTTSRGGTRSSPRPPRRPSPRSTRGTGTTTRSARWGRRSRCT